MTDDRWREVNASDTLPLTADEIAAGWHFCPEWDGLLIGPGMGEFDEFCECEVPR